MTCVALDAECKLIFSVWGKNGHVGLSTLKTGNTKFCTEDKSLYLLIVNGWKRINVATKYENKNFVDYEIEIEMFVLEVHCRIFFCRL